MTDAPKYADLATLARELCAGESTIEGLVRQGKFPQPYHLGGKRLWKWSEVEATIAASRDDFVKNVPAVTEGGIREAAKRVSRGGG
jgi:predicted DNA-binding transcriptional regulator AlpA